MNSSFGTTVARRRRPHFRHSLASGPLTDQLCTSRFGERGISTPTCWGLLKQPDNQKLPRAGPPASERAANEQRILAGRQNLTEEQKKRILCNAARIEGHPDYVDTTFGRCQPSQSGANCGATSGDQFSLYQRGFWLKTKTLAYYLSDERNEDVVLR